MSDNAQLQLGVQSEIPCMLLPMEGYFILVPTVSVAEMAPVLPLKTVENTPDWLMGHYEWRNTLVPVIAFDTLNGEELKPINPNGRIAVLNNTGVNPSVPFIALHTQGIPRMSRVGQDDIEQDDAVTVRPFDLMAVKVGLEDFIIPNVSAMEEVYSELNLPL